MSTFRSKLGILVAGVLLGVASMFVGLATKVAPAPQDQKLSGAVSFNPTQATPSYLSGAGVTSVATTVAVTAFTTRQGTPITTANIGGIGFATIDPGTVKEENISFTGITQNANGTASLTGVTRGLLPFYPYTASTTLSVAHSGGATVITSNSGAFYNQFNIAANTSSITGAWSFASSAIPTFTTDTITTQFNSAFQIVDKAYVDSVATSGAANADFSTKGIIQLATTSQLIAGTAAGSTGASLVVPNSFFSQTSTATSIVPVTTASGTLADSFIGQALQDVYSFLGQITFNGTTTFQRATSSVIVTDSNGAVTPLNAGGNNNGATVAFSNGAWGIGIPKSFQTFSAISSNGVLTNIATLTLPTAGPTSIYNIDFAFNGPNAPASSTLVLNGFSIDATCKYNSLSMLIGTMQIVMQNSTTSEWISTYLYDSQQTLTPICVLFGYFGVTMTSTPSLDIQIRQNSTSTVTGTSTIFMIQ